MRTTTRSSFLSIPITFTTSQLRQRMRSMLFRTME